MELRLQASHMQMSPAEKKMLSHHSRENRMESMLVETYMEDASMERAQSDVNVVRVVATSGGNRSAKAAPKEGIVVAGATHAEEDAVAWEETAVSKEGLRYWSSFIVEVDAASRLAFFSFLF
ncbi:unnamed protein product [Sphagnum balticum]